MTDEQIRAAVVGEVREHNASVELAEYDPTWPELFRREEARIRGALGDRVLLLEHIGLRLNHRKTILQPVDRGMDFVGQVVKPWRTHTRRRRIRSDNNRPAIITTAATRTICLPGS